MLNPIVIENQMQTVNGQFNTQHSIKVVQGTPNIGNSHNVASPNGINRIRLIEMKLHNSIQIFLNIAKSTSI